MKLNLQNKQKILQECYTWTPKSGSDSWSQQFSLVTARAWAASVLLPAGRMLVMGGVDSGNRSDNRLMGCFVC